MSCELFRFLCRFLSLFVRPDSELLDYPKTQGKRKR